MERKKHSFEPAWKKRKIIPVRKTETQPKRGSKADQELALFWHNSTDLFMFLSQTADLYKRQIKSYQKISKFPVKISCLGEGANGYTRKVIFEVNGKIMKVVLKGSLQNISENLFWEWKALIL